MDGAGKAQQGNEIGPGCGQARAVGDGVARPRWRGAVRAGPGCDRRGPGRDQHGWRDCRVVPAAQPARRAYRRRDPGRAHAEPGIGGRPRCCPAAPAAADTADPRSADRHSAVVGGSALRGELAELNYLRDPTWVRVRTLVLHGADDTLVPVADSARLAAARPDLVTLLRFPGADHVESWNADRSRYEQAVRGFLTTVAR